MNLDYFCFHFQEIKSILTNNSEKENEIHKNTKLNKKE